MRVEAGASYRLPGWHPSYTHLKAQPGSFWAGGYARKGEFSMGYILAIVLVVVAVVLLALLILGLS